MLDFLLHSNLLPLGFFLAFFEDLFLLVFKGVLDGDFGYFFSGYNGGVRLVLALLEVVDPFDFSDSVGAVVVGVEGSESEEFG